MSKSSILMYDIPTRTNFPNPTARLWRCGTRLNLSCWVVRADLVPWTLLNEMKDAGVRWHLLPFSDADSKEATALMLGNIRDELKAAQAREAKSLREQDETLAAAETAAGNVMTSELLAARRKHAKDRAGVIKRTEKIVKLLKESASLFSLEGIDFSTSENRVRALKALNGARATLYTQMVDAVAGTPLAVAANENSVPAGILADYAEETTGGDFSLARAAFDTDDCTGTTGGVIATSSNNNAATISRPRWSVQPRTHSVSTRTGTTTVTSGYTNAEAMAIIRDLSGNSFARSLSRQFDNRGSLSTSQWKWVHIIAVQNTPEMRDALAPDEIETVQEPVIETPIETPVITAPAPQVTIDDTVPGETVNPDPLAEEITTQNMTWTSANKTLTCEASSVNCRAFTKTMRVKSHKTGSIKVFTLDREVTDNEDEVLSVIYKAVDGTTLVILND
jgi:hypothetical protein